MTSNKSIARAFASLAFACICHSAIAAGVAPAETSGRNTVQTVREMLATPDDRIDFARAKLTFDKLVDPKTDIAGGLKRIDEMVRAVRALAGPNATDMEKLRAVRIYIYESRGWNGNKPFHYDLTDPFGRNIANKLLSHYISSRGGNCVTMPALFIVLADRMGLKVTVSVAPLHEFVKYTDRTTGKAYNLETTSGGYPARDVWYRQKMPMTDAAVRNGVYMKTLTKRETLAVMADVVVEHDLTVKRYREAAEVASEILKVYPNFALVMAQRGTAYAYLIDTEFRARYPTPRDIPIELRSEYLSLAEGNRTDFDRAEALGWKPGE